MILLSSQSTAVPAGVVDDLQIVCNKESLVPTTHQDPTALLNQVNMRCTLRVADNLVSVLCLDELFRRIVTPCMGDGEKPKIEASKPFYKVDWRYGMEEHCENAPIYRV